jgi:2,4-dienoyl-CoA reductase-like NADH-dependent reductase (Old Yellow Enzyme family)
MYPRIASLKTIEALRQRLDELQIDLPLDEVLLSAPDSPLAQPLAAPAVIGNRWCILPMEGWDGTPDGRPTEHVRRRWRRFGESGAKLIWGGEAVAVEHAGRANPRQLLLTSATAPEIASLREDLVVAHAHQFGSTDDLYVGLQLTYSGRFAKPNDDARPEPRVLYRHPILDAKVSKDGPPHVLTDDEIRSIIQRFIDSASLAAEAGFHFVDIKHCHGYLGHEFLSAYDRPGPYGGSFENRTRFLREIVEGIRARTPHLQIGVRLSAIDWIPFRPNQAGEGEPCRGDLNPHYPYAFGGDGSGTGMSLDEPLAFLDLCRDLEIRLVCISVGSPYYNPHIQRPALFPPSDGYLPPEDPLVGVARQIHLVAELKRLRPELVYVGSGYSYLQEWLPHVAQAAVRAGMVDLVGIGRLTLTYPELCADVLAGRPLQTKRLCRTFSDCTTAPRHGLVSGCYPLDDYYKQLPEHKQVVALRPKWRK